ncbi:MAG: hypothetical protein RLZZ301_60 [Bacteroidota bacterium]|jgi:hypothetical protein
MNKSFIIALFMLLSSATWAQYRTLILKSGNEYRYSRLYFISDDSLFFKAKQDQEIYKVATKDIQSSYYIHYSQSHFHFNDKNKNLRPLKIGVGVGVGLLIGGAALGAGLSYAAWGDGAISIIFGILGAGPGSVVLSVCKENLRMKQIHQMAIPVN